VATLGGGACLASLTLLLLCVPEDSARARADKGE